MFTTFWILPLEIPPEIQKSWHNEKFPIFHANRQMNFKTAGKNLYIIYSVNKMKTPYRNRILHYLPLYILVQFELYACPKVRDAMFEFYKSYTVYCIAYKLKKNLSTDFYHFKTSFTTFSSNFSTAAYLYYKLNFTLNISLKSIFADTL